MPDPSAPVEQPTLVRWQSIDKRMQFRSGAVEPAGLGPLVERRFKAGDRELVAFCEGREVGWISRVDGRRTYSYERLGVSDAS